MLSGYEDLAESLAIEVKREIAERYFTHRKVIEEEIEAYQQALKAFEKEEEKVLWELLRLTQLLRDRDLIARFRELTGISLEFYLDEYILSSKTIRRRLFRELKSRGLTSKRRFLKLFEDTYKRLLRRLEEYRRKFRALKAQAELINQDIQEFQREYDLGSIFNFLGSLEGGGPAIGGVEEKGKVYDQLTEALRFPPVVPPEEKFTDFPAPPSWKEVGHELLKLAKEAYKRHTGEVKQILEVLSS